MPAQPRDALPFHYVMAVWGARYVDMLLEAALPCLLAPGNLPSLANLPVSRMLLITTPPDRRRIESSPVFARLRDLLVVEFHEPPWLSGDLPYWRRAARAHQLAARIGLAQDAWSVYLAPDFLLSDGALTRLVDLAASGKTAVLVPGIRVVTETILPALRAAFPRADGAPLAIAPRPLVKLCLQHVHPENQRFEWSHPCFSDCPVVCTWKVPGEPDALLLRAFHLHPLLLRVSDPATTELLETNTIDGEFLALNCPDWDAIHVETDSDQLALFSLTSAHERLKPEIARQASAEALRVLAYSPLVNPLHRYYFTKAIRLHGGPMGEGWKALERETGRMAYRVLTFGSDTLGAADPEHLLPLLSGRLMLREALARAGHKVTGGVRALLRRR